MTASVLTMGPFKCYVTPWGGGVSFPRKKRYEGVRFNVISVTRGWVGVKFPGKKRYVTLEWPLMVVIGLTKCIVAVLTPCVAILIISVSPELYPIMIIRHTKWIFSRDAGIQPVAISQVL